MWRMIIISLLAALAGVSSHQRYYLKQCPRNQIEIDNCLKESGNKLVQHLRHRIPELDVNEIEPVVLDEIAIMLGSGPDGYRAIFRNVQAYGVSNMTVKNVRSDLNTLQFQFTCEIPHIRVRAQYSSSGLLFVVRASGAGDYWGEYDGARANIYLKASPHPSVDGKTYLSADLVKIDFNVKNIRMGVDNVANSNSVLQAALNLFINANAQELLTEMKPSLQVKLTTVIQGFMNHLFRKIPLDDWIDLDSD